MTTLRLKQRPQEPSKSTGGVQTPPTVERPACGPVSQPEHHYWKQAARALELLGVRVRVPVALRPQISALRAECERLALVAGAEFNRTKKKGPSDEARPSEIPANKLKVSQ